VYQPTHRLLSLVRDVSAADPGIGVLVVDDGSDDTAVLDEAAELGCTVLRHETNRGKGVALKTGFRHLAAAYAGQDVVCADADGQHSATDVRRIAARVGETGRMVLGVRRFDGDVPARSRLGNAITQALFQAATGRMVRDTQTGLRGYPADRLDWLGTVPGDRFEYEMNVLLYAARAGLEIDQVDIATTYLDDNASSHFNPFGDAARVYLPLLRFAALASVSGRR
jgi:glycosyltransferase involved in cell wall biosynthesis